ncbi:MAG: putative aminoacrylate hydrolase RutD [Candidatus Heimdallarchaeota archaeon LC_2]|nr:MAG: putative aminoacrylate hydrolase RutD [Candidatus Heimdallarchaeota archaeon LC_2]
MKIDTGKIEIADGSRISYRTTGDMNKTKIMLVSGSIFNYQQFETVLFPALKSRLKGDYCYIQYDYVGIGESSQLNGEFEFLKIADQHLEFMDALGIENAHHFGYSKGSIISFFAAMKSQKRALSVASYGSPNLAYVGDGTTRNEFMKRLEYLNSISGIWGNLIDSKNFRVFYDTVFLPTIFEGKQAQNLGIFDNIKSWWIRKKIEPFLTGTLIHNLVKLYQLYIEEITEGDRQKYIDTLKEITIPTLLLHSEFDEIVPVQGARELSTYLQNNKMIEYNKFSHSSPVLRKKEGKRIMTDYSNFILSL